MSIQVFTGNDPPRPAATHDLPRATTHSTPKHPAPGGTNIQERTP